MSTTEVKAESSPAKFEDSFYPDKTAGQKAEAAPAEVEEKLPAETKVENQPEAAPGEIKEESGETSKKQLTPEERSDRDRKRNERRWADSQRKLGETQARLAERERELEELRKQRAESSPAPRTTVSDGVMTWEEFYEANPEKGTADYKAYVLAEGKKQGEASIAERQKQAEQQKRREEAEERRKAADLQYQEREQAFIKANPDVDYEEAWEAVAGAIDKVKAGDLQAALWESEVAPEAVIYLSEHPEKLKTMLQLEPVARVKAFGRLEEQLSTKTPPKEKNKATGAKPAPDTLSGKGGSAATPKELHDYFYE